LLRRNRLVDLHRRLIAYLQRLLENARHCFQDVEGILRVLGPDATLRRGYSITMKERGKIIRGNRGSPAKDENSLRIERRRIQLGDSLAAAVSLRADPEIVFQSLLASRFCMSSSERNKYQ
jgi:exonuclease VII large subunit